MAETPTSKKRQRRLSLIVEPRAEPGPKAKHSQIKFPSVDLRGAAQVPKAMALHNAARCTHADAYAFLEDLGAGGSPNIKVAAAGHYGFVLTGRGYIVLTDLGAQTIEPPTRIHAFRKGFLQVPLFRELAERYSREPLPSDVELERYMAELGVTPSAASRARWSFYGAAKQAQLLTENEDRLQIPHGLFAEAEEKPKPLVKSESVTVVPIHPEAKTFVPGSFKAAQVVEELHDVDIDPILMGLLRRLPKDPESWSPEARAKWWEAWRVTFRLVYGDPEPD
jgi:hypothetical protein